MKTTYLVLLLIILLCFKGQAQTPVNASVNASGWKRVAYVTGAAARGFGKISIFTTGGSDTPNYLDIEWFKDWAISAGMSLKTNSKTGAWSDARLTFDKDTLFIEVNFNKAVGSLSMLSDGYGWNITKLYSGILPDGGGTVRAEARTGQLNLNNHFYVAYNGFVGIGTKSPKEALSVDGNIRARQVKVEVANWPDYVFDEEYELPSLKNTAIFIKENKHLPGVPTAKEVEKDGISVGEMNKILLQKIEELTLHLIEKDKVAKNQENEINKLQEKIERVEQKIAN